MKNIMLVLVVLLAACTHKSKTDSMADIRELQFKATYYYLNQNDSIYVRCDKLAFKPYITVYGYTQDLSGFEDNGKWQRDVRTNPSCYPDESKGSISFDSMISVLHHIWTTKDKAMLDRLIAYGNATDWIIGEGDFANQILLKPICLYMRNKMEARTPAINEDLANVLKGFRGHLLASYIWLMGRMNGAINDIENETAKALVDASPEDPMYVALYHRFNDGDQSKAIDILINSPFFPRNELPTSTGIYGWGSAPSSVYYLLSLSILEGR